MKLLKINKQKFEATCLHRQGFTLIELLVAITIIGILSSIIIASASAARMKSRDAKRVSDVSNISVALEFYFANNGRYPAAYSDLVASLVPNYIGSIPNDPLGGNYSYSGVVGSTGLCTRYHIGASLEAAANMSGDNAGAETACAGGADFDGASNQPCNASDKGKYCYDKKR
ncbi:MAG: prepilin-type N-terminal cleavage/methylation domain-containing protein [Candidatus Paceibacterota bacterium]